MFIAQDFTPEHDAHIVMAHYRAHERQHNRTWRYSEESCFAQFAEAFPKLKVPFSTFSKYRRELIRRFETNFCICKENNYWTTISRKKNIKPPPNKKLALKVIGTQELLNKIDDNMFHNLKDNSKPDKVSEVDVTKVTISREMYKKLSNKFDEKSYHLDQGSNVSQAFCKDTLNASSWHSDLKTTQVTSLNSKQNDVVQEKPEVSPKILNQYMPNAIQIRKKADVEFVQTSDHKKNLGIKSEIKDLKQTNNVHKTKLLAIKTPNEANQNIPRIFAVPNPRKFTPMLSCPNTNRKNYDQNMRKITAIESLRKKAIPNNVQSSGLLKKDAQNVNDHIPKASAIQTSGNISSKPVQNVGKLQTIPAKRPFAMFQNYKPNVQNRTFTSDGKPLKLSVQNISAKPVSEECEDSGSDGLEEIPFPTDPVLPETESTTMEEFTLCPTSGKLIDVDFPTTEEPNNEIEFAPVAINDDKEEPPKALIEAEDPLRETTEPNELLRGTSFENHTASVRVVPIDKLMKCEDPSTNKTKFSNVAASISNNKAAAEVSNALKRKVSISDIPQIKKMKIEDCTGNTKKLGFKSVAMSIHNSKGCIEKLAFPNNLEGEKKRPTCKKFYSGPKARKLINVTFVQGINKIMESPDGRKKMILIRKHTRGIKATGKELLMKSNTPTSLSNTTYGKEPEPEIDGSVNIVKEEPTEIIEIF